MARSDRQRVVAVCSGASRRGRWRVPPRVTAIAVAGGVRLDLREAVIEDAVIEIRAWAVMGNVVVRVPDGTDVDLVGTVLMGSASDRTTGPHADDGPLIRVLCRGLWGGVEVKSTSAGGRNGAGAARVGSGTVSILVTDIVGSTSMAEGLGDQRWLEVLRAHDLLVREQIDRHGGTEVKHVGDGFVATFPSARDAVRAALGVQSAIDGYSDQHPDAPLSLRLAVHAGEVEVVDGDVFGLNVSTAAHLAAVAAPGEVLVSGVVSDLAGSTSDLRFGSARTIHLPGRTHPFPVHTAVPA